MNNPKKQISCHFIQNKNYQKIGNIITLAVFAVGFPMLYLNCGKGFQRNQLTQSSLLQPGDGGDQSTCVECPLVEFGSGVQVPNCMSQHSEKYNGCIFYKNPVFQAGKILNPPVAINVAEFGSSQVDPVGLYNNDKYLTYAVKTPQGGLDNENFTVEEVVYGPDDMGFQFSPTVATNGEFKFSTKGPSYLNLVDYTMYFWLNHFLLKIKAQSGATPYAAAKAVIAVPHYYYYRPQGATKDEVLRNAAWTGRNSNAMVFGATLSKGTDSNGFDVYSSMALSGGVLAHEFGHAQLEYGADLTNGTTSNDRSCGSGGANACSRTINGSLFAIHEGVADVYAYLMFDTSVFGEDVMDDLAGMDHCGNEPRSMKGVKDLGLTAQALFDACSTLQMAGEVHAMGTVYSTIWYGIIEAARQVSQVDYAEAIMLFYEHQKYVSEMDTFKTLKSVIHDLDQDMYGGKFSQSIDHEYAAMGL